MPSKYLAPPERPGEICFQDIPPRFFRKVDGGRPFDIACTVHQYVHFAKALECFRQEVLQRSEMAHIARDTKGSARQRFYFTSGFGCFMRVAHRNAPDYGIYGLLDFWQIFGKTVF